MLIMLNDCRDIFLSTCLFHPTHLIDSMHFHAQNVMLRESWKDRSVIYCNHCIYDVMLRDALWVKFRKTNSPAIIVAFLPGVKCTQSGSQSEMEALLLVAGPTWAFKIFMLKVVYSLPFETKLFYKSSFIFCTNQF